MNPRIPNEVLKKMATLMLEKLGIPENPVDITEEHFIKLGIFNQMLSVIAVASIECKMHTDDVKQIMEAAMQVHLELQTSSVAIADKFFDNLKNN